MSKDYGVFHLDLRQGRDTRRPTEEMTLFEYELVVFDGQLEIGTTTPYCNPDLAFIYGV